MEFRISDKDAVTLPHIGRVRGVVDYFHGYPSTYWEPAEGPEIERASLVDAYGRPVLFDAMPDEAWDEAWCALEDAVGEMYADAMAEDYARFAGELAAEEYTP